MAKNLTAKEKMKPEAQGRMLVADPAAPGVPAQGGRPAIPAGLREATHREVWLWEAKVDVQLRGGLWTDETARQYGEHYDKEMSEYEQ